MWLKTTLLFIFLCLRTVSFAQDAQFTQFYNAPLYLNPALTGSGEEYRLAANYRAQWLSADAFFHSTTFSFDYSAPQYRSGFGFLAGYDKAGGTRLTTTHFSGLYSFTAPFAQGKWQLRFGLQGTFARRAIDYSDLVFVSQVLDDEPDVWEGAEGATARSFLDFSSGMALYNKSIFVGLAAHHLNQPESSFLGSGKTPMKISFQLVSRIEVYTHNGNLYFMPSFLFKKQGAAQQAEAGLRLGFEHSPLVFGAYYRGIPFISKVPNTVNQDALAVSVGLNKGNFVIGYSYDLTISGLAAYTGGSHEISIIYQRSSQRREWRKSVVCPLYERKM